MDFSKTLWTNESYNEFVKMLETHNETKYIEFQNKLIPTSLKILGIRGPKLKEISKSIAKSDWRSFYALKRTNYYEEIYIRGQILGFIKEDKEIIKNYFENFVKEVDNWAICDSAVCNLKIIKKEKEYFFPVIKNLSNSSNPWEIRVGLICLLSHYIEKEYLNEIFSIISSVKNKEYYVQMGQAWLLATLFAKYRDETFQYLQNNSLDSWVQNKAIQKMRESFRVSSEDKELILQFKKK